MHRGADGAVGIVPMGLFGRGVAGSVFGGTPWWTVCTLWWGYGGCVVVCGKGAGEAQGAPPWGGRCMVALRWRIAWAGCAGPPRAYWGAAAHRGEGRRPVFVMGRFRPAGPSRKAAA